MASKSTTAAAPETTEVKAEQEIVILSGRLVADPELHFTKTSGKPVSNIRIAVTDGGVTTFHTVVVWGRTAEVVCQFLKKGRAVEVRGRSQERSYQPAEGDARQITEIVAHSVQFLGRQPQVETGREVA